MNFKRKIFRPGSKNSTGKLNMELDNGKSE